jgi:hypothetical protein
MQKLMMISIPSEPDARVEVWLERAASRAGHPYVHAISYRGGKELSRRTAAADAGEAVPVSARRLCRELCDGLGWAAAGMR